MFNQKSVRRLYRSRADRQMTGVAGGLADYLEVDPTVVRIVWVVAAFTTFPIAPILYFILAMIIPQEPVSSSDAYMI
jgi:phage shock protein C